MMLSTINLTVILETLILGIVASSIVAIAVELWKKRSKRYHISVTLDSCEVYVSQEKSDVMIKVDYKGRAVENALVVMYVCFTNEGENDISFKSHFSDAIAVKCEGYDFLSFTAEESLVDPKCFLNEDGSALFIMGYSQGRRNDTSLYSGSFEYISEGRSGWGRLFQ